MRETPLKNRFAYIPPQCYTKTQGSEKRASNPCYPCHQHSAPPNFIDDADLQLSFQLPGTATANPWRNLFDPPVQRVPRPSDAEMLAYVRQSNYFDDASPRAGGERAIALAARLAPLAPEWDASTRSTWPWWKH
jgi:hypothetical protein